MTVVTTRLDFEKLMALRMKEAKLLIDQQQWDGAYYLAGYAVEFALKIRIIGLLKQTDAFPSKADADRFYKHNLGELLSVARLKDEMGQDPAIGPLWDIVKDWSEQSRYEIGRTEQTAKDLYNAIESGVLPWIRARW